MSKAGEFCATIAIPLDEYKELLEDRAMLASLAEERCFLEKMVMKLLDILESRA